ncbi:hypothetical protein GQ55_3G371400 [Panicum hallii var. hallii]|uniref:Rho GDP-dissociation inhibitor 1 n=1 Tax=Panicum hallii var. hallii TaxID=1504633 RepID=A0A2T7EG73_9POAL|nr:hypothetical protein GQ55_3G371400 [Panicum hallii var. hallii]
MDDKEKEKEKEKEKHEGNHIEEEEENEEGNKRIVVLGPQVPLKEQLELDKDDESLRRWKEQLLGQVDTEQLGETAEPEVKVMNLTILSPGRPDLVLPIPFQADEKGYAFALKDGSPYSFRFSFIVSNNIVSGLKYTNIVWKTGVRVENQKMMLGTFSPQLEPYVYEGEEETTPAGIFARGSYSAKLKFVDDDSKCYLEMSYYFEIRKEWPGAQ